MLWNWYTIDACFLSRTWHIRSKGAFGGSCIGVILLVISLEFLRRTQREFDRYLTRRNRSHLAVADSRDGSSDESGEDAGSGARKNGNISARLLSRGRTDYASRLKLWQQVVRSFLYMMQFAVGYFAMLLAMYYNGRLWNLQDWQRPSKLIID